MYSQIINKIKELGDLIAPIAGNVVDTGEKKAWLTEWDLKIEQDLTVLINTFPGKHNVFAEEISDYYKESEDVWIIDPISNTFNFIHGLPHYSIALSHLHKGKIIFAAVYDPAMKELFTAEKGKGTFLNADKVVVSGRINDLAILVGPHLVPKGKYIKGTIELMKLFSEIGGIRTLGSLGVHYAYVACGRADVAITLNKDVFPEFAGKLLVEEAGGNFTDFNEDSLTITTHGIVASNGKVNNMILERIKLL